MKLIHIKLLIRRTSVSLVAMSGIFIFYGPNIENRILRRIFGPKWDENGERRWLQNEELHSLNRSPNIVRVIKED